MTDARIKVQDVVTGGLIARPTLAESVMILGMFHAELVRDDEVIWTDDFPNVVTDQGKKAILDTFLNLAAAYAAIRLGLHTTVGNASSTYASPSPQVESTAYTGNRGTPTFSAAAGTNPSPVSKATSAAVGFAINGTAAITGAFACLGAAANLNTPGDTATASAVLLSSGAFTGGTRSVINGDTLNVTYTLTLT